MSKAAAGLLASKTPWELRAAQAIRNRRDVRVIRERTDVVVRYLLDRPQKGDPSLEQALNSLGLDGDEARAQAREMLDRALFGGHPSPEMLLGIKAAAGPERIRQQYKRLVQLYHPDRSKDADEALGNERVQRLRKAYETLLERATGELDAANATSSNRSTSQGSPQSVRMDPHRHRRNWSRVRSSARSSPRSSPHSSPHSSTRSQPDKRSGKPPRSILRVSRWMKMAAVAASLYGVFLIVTTLWPTEPPAVTENATQPSPLVSYPVVNDLVRGLEIAYARGDVDAIMALFASNASVNALRDTDSIRADFERQFQMRRTTGLVFKSGIARKIGNNELVVEGVADAASGDVRIASPFKILIAWTDGQPAIRHLEHRLSL